MAPCVNRDRGAAVAASLLIAVFLCSAPARAAQFSFAAFGDTPYNAAEELQLPVMLDEMNRQPLAFTLHVGDFKSSGTSCSDELFLNRHKSFSSSHHPFVFVPGDNEWTDCDRAAPPREPLERLSRLRDVFFASGSTLGQRTFRLEQQKARGYTEHVRWVHQNVVFATFNVPGPDNNRTRMPEESQRRTGAVLEWMRDTFRLARDRKLPGVVLAMQANLWTGRRGYAEIVATLAGEAQRYNGQILVIHGDTHWFRFDRPLAARNISNLQRLEVFGSPFTAWTLVTVTIENGRARFDATQGGDAASRAQPAAAER